MNNAPDFFVEIFLQPGDFYWGDSETRIRTLLGSCVALTMWHPERKEGGMCHFMLPGRPGKTGPGLNGRYADEAMELFLKEVQRTNTRLSEYEVKVFGGSDMFEKFEGVQTVGSRNIEAAEELAQKHKFRILARDVGGDRYRRVFFDVWNGSVWMQRGDAHRPSGSSR